MAASVEDNFRSQVAIGSKFLTLSLKANWCFLSILRLKTFILLVAEIKMGILFTEHHADILQFQENNLQSPIDKLPHWSDNICFFII